MRWKLSMIRVTLAVVVFTTILASYTNGLTKNAQAAISSKEQASAYLNSVVEYLNFGQKDTITYNFDIKKEAQQRGALYTWYVKADKGDPDAVSINSKTGVVTAMKAGTAYIRCKITLADGRVLRPEAKVVVRNNINQVDISNMPAGQTIVAGQAMDFNRIILNTDAGKGMTSKGITRWEIDDDTAGVGKIDDNGIVKPSTKGVFSIRAICFQSKDKYHQWLEDKEANGKYITASSKWYKVTVVAYNAEATAATQVELDKALAFGNNTKITISTDKDIKFTIPKGEYLDTTLIVDAPNAEIDNYASFKNIVISAIKDNTWNENANGNTFHVTSIKVRIIVNGNAEVKEIVFDRENSVLNIEVEGIIHQITILQPSDLKLSGDGGQVPITIEETGGGSKITTSIPVRIEANANSEVIINPGAEGTSINKSKEDILVKVENHCNQSVGITTNNSGEETIKAGESGVSQKAAQPAAPTLSSIAIKNPASKTVYVIGEPLDITGLVIEGTYSDSNKKIESCTAANISGFDSTKAADSQILTISMDGKTASYIITIKTMQLTITTPSVTQSKIYDGNTSAVVKAGILSGIRKEDTVTVSAAAAFDSKNVGTNKIITVIYTLGGKDAALYAAPDNDTIDTGTIAAAQLSIKAPDITLSKTYDGSKTAEVAEGALTGVIAGEDVTVSATAAYDSNLVGTGKTITVGYALSGADAANYIVPDDYTVHTGVIMAKQLTVESPVLTASKVYDKSTAADVTAGKLIDVVGDDDVIVSATAVYDTAEAGTEKTITVVYTLSGADKANYIKPADDIISSGIIKAITLTILNPELTVSKVYDGNPEAVVVAGTLSGVLQDDAVTVSAVAAYDTAKTGNNKKITVVYTLGGADAANYMKPADDISSAGTISAKQLTITNPDITLSKVYDGSQTAAVVAGTLSGLLDGDDVLLTTAAAYDDKSVGTGKQITVVYTLSGKDSDQYIAPESYIVNTGEITAALLSITAPAITKSKIYDGTTEASVIAGTLTGVIAGDAAIINALATYASEKVGTAKKINVVYTLSGKDSANYVKPEDYEITTGVITAKQLTAADPVLTRSKIYDSNTAAKVTAGALSGIITGDEVTLSAVAAFDTKKVDTGKIITVVYTLGGADADQYIAPADDMEDTGEIIAVPLTMASPSITMSKIYDGSTTASVTAGTLAGVIGGDQVVLSVKADYATAGAGENKTITVAGTLSGADAANYIVPDDYTVHTGVIMAKQLTVESPVLTASKVYDGTTTADVTAGKLLGVVGDDDVTVSAIAVYDTAEVGTEKTITVGYTLSGADAGNYIKPADDIVNTGIIKAIPLTISNPKLTLSKVYDGNLTAAVVPGTLSGILDGEAVTVNAVAAYDTAKTGNNKKITVVYTLEGADAANYMKPADDISYIGTISAKQLTITNPDITLSKVYDGSQSAAVVTGTLSGVLDGGDVLLTTSATYDDKTVGTGKQITVVYTLSGEDADQYTAPESYIVNTGKITAALLMIADPAITESKIYDGTTEASVITGTLTGVIAGDDMTINALAAYDSKKVGTDKKINVVYTLSGKDAANYVKPEDYEVTTGVITAAPLTVTSQLLTTSKGYDGNTTANITAGVLTGVMGEDEVAVNTIAAYNSAEIGKDKIIDVAYTISGEDAANYEKPVDYTVENCIISAIPLTISQPDITKYKIYDATTTAAVTAGTLSGVLEGDIVTVSAVATYDNKNAGSDKTITVVYTLAGDDASHYTAPDNYIDKTGSIGRLYVYSGGLSFEGSKVYDGNTTMNILSSKLSNGIIAGDDVTLLSTVANYDTAKVGTDKPVTVEFVLGGADAANYYNVPQYMWNGTSITAKQLEIAEPDLTLSKLYDGTTAADVTAGKLIGVVGDDDVTVSAVAVYDTAEVGTEKTITVVYTLLGADAGNYIKPVDDIVNTGIIKAIPLTISNPDITTHKIYDATTTAAVTAGTLSGVLEGDNVTVSAAATYDNKNVGSGKTITVVYTLAGDDASHYTAPDNYFDKTGTIVRLWAYGGEVLYYSGKVYDGNTTIKIADSELGNNIIAGDDVTLLSTVANYDTAEVGTRKSATIEFVLGGADAANYDIEPRYLNGANYITAKQLEITEPNLTLSKVYDGTTAADVTAGDLIGVVGDDDVTVSAVAVYDTAEVGTEKTITVVYTLLGADAGNYIKPADDIVNTGIIKTIPLTISNPDITTKKTYDATMTAAATAGTLSGVLEGDIVTVSAAATYDNKNAGSGKTITVVYTLAGEDADHYKAPVIYSVDTGEIEAVQLSKPSYQTIELSRQYDGTTNANVLIYGPIGIVDGDNVTVSTEANYDTPEVGTDKTLTVTFTISGEDAVNYIKPADDKFGSRAILARDLDISTPNLTLRKAYDGTTTADVNAGELTGVVAGDEVHVSAVANYDTAEIGKDKHIKVVYTLSGADAANYTKPADYTVLTGEIEEAQLTVTPPSLTMSKVYDGTTTADVIAGELTGVVTGEEVHVSAVANYDTAEVGTNKTITVVYTLSGADSTKYKAPENKTFPGTITVPDLSYITTAAVNITRPSAGSFPVNAAEVQAATNNADFTVISISWSGSMTTYGSFGENALITATVVLTSKNYKAFQEASFTPVVEGANSIGVTTTIGTETGNTVSFTVNFSSGDFLKGVAGAFYGMATESGTLENPETWFINVENGKDTLALSDIEVTTNAAAKLFTNPDFTTGEITGENTIPLIVGDNKVYIKVTTADTAEHYFIVNLNRAKILSKDTSLLSVAGQTDSTPEGNGTSEMLPTYWKITVPNEITSLTLADIITAEYSKINVYKTSQFREDQDLPLALNVGSTNTFIRVEAEDGTRGYYYVTITRAAPKEITAATAMGDIPAKYGTILGEAGLPSTAEVTLDDASTRILAVTWNGGTPAYDGNTAGTYTFDGILTLPVGIANTLGVKVSVKVIVAEKVLGKEPLTTAINGEYSDGATRSEYTIIPEDYTTDSWATYIGSISDAITVENTETVTQEQIDNAIAAIGISKAGLIFAGKEVLDAAKIAAGELTATDYTSENWASLTTALSLPEATNAEIISKTSAITNAIAVLKTELINAAITSAKALIPATISVVEGTDANLLTMLNALDGMGATGVALTLDVPENVNIAADGTITYTGAEATVNIIVKINKAAGTEQAVTVSVTVPKAITYSIYLESKATSYGFDMQATGYSGYSISIPDTIIKTSDSGTITNLAIHYEGTNPEAFTITYNTDYAWNTTLDDGTRWSFFRAHPKDGLLKGTYSAILVITADHDVRLEIPIQFKVAG